MTFRQASTDTARQLKVCVTALRAFHTGLVSELHRHLHALKQFEPHIDVLRHPARHKREKLAAAHRSWRHLQHCEHIRASSRATYLDFKRSLRRVRVLLRLLLENERRRLRS